MAGRTPAMNAASIKPTSLPIGELLDSRSPARVPRYQRAYAWTDENVTDLIEDVRRLFPFQKGEAGHFYGGMVAIAVPDASEARGLYYEIVDGQQRLATFCLLLAQLALEADRLREEAMQAGKLHEAKKFEIYAAQVRDSYLYYQKYDVEEGSQKPEPRVRLNLADDDVFQDLLQGKVPSVDAGRQSHSLLVEAASLLRERLVEAVDRSNLSTSRASLVRLQEAVLQDSFVIHIVGDSRASGYRLFAVLNDRGARLTVADLLRSHHLEMLDAYPKIRESAASLWDDLLLAGGDDVDRFLATYYTSIEGQRPKPQDLFDEVKELLFPKPARSAAAANAMLGTLKSAYNALLQYRDIRVGKWPFPQRQSSKATLGDWDRLRLDRLINIVRHDLADPLLLAACSLGDEERFAELVHMLELFAFRYKNVCGGHTAPASSAYYKECKRIRGLSAGATVSWSTLRNDLRTQLQKRAADDIFASAIRSKLTYDNPSARLNIRELLSIVEDYSAWLGRGAKGTPKPDKLVTHDLSKASIEHIQPQNPQVTNRSLADHVHRLGNLSYWSPDDNSAAGNEDFVTKKSIYATSKVGLNRELSSLRRWDLAELEKREKELIKRACLVFRV